MYDAIANRTNKRVFDAYWGEYKCDNWQVYEYIEEVASRQDKK